MKKLTLTIRCILVSLTILTSCRQDDHPAEHLMPGEEMPSFDTYTLSGRNIHSDELAGRPTILILFSTSCHDCHEQLPEIERIYTDMDESVNVLAIARDEGEEAVRDFWNAYRFTMPVAAPGNRDIYNLFDRGSASGVPQTYIFTSEGILERFSLDDSLLCYEQITQTLLKMNVNR